MPTVVATHLHQPLNLVYSSELLKHAVLSQDKLAYLDLRSYVIINLEKRGGNTGSGHQP